MHHQIAGSGPGGDGHHNRRGAPTRRRRCCPVELDRTRALGGAEVGPCYRYRRTDRARSRGQTRDGGRRRG